MSTSKDASWQVLDYEEFHVLPFTRQGTHLTAFLCAHILRFSSPVMAFMLPQGAGVQQCMAHDISHCLSTVMAQCVCAHVTVTVV